MKMHFHFKHEMQQDWFKKMFFKKATNIPKNM